MQSNNAYFKNIDYWTQNKVLKINDVLDLARCLEDIGFRCVHSWHFVDGAEGAKPNLETILKASEYNIIGSNPALTASTGWVAQQMPLPLIAKMTDSARWGKWHFEVNSGYVLELYCNDTLIDNDVFLGRSIDICDSCKPENNPWVYVKIATVQKKGISLQSARVSLSGLKEYNDLIRDMARSLRTSCHLLIKENCRNNLYMSGAVDINSSPISDKERADLSRVLCQAANLIDMKAAVDMDLGRFIRSLGKCKITLAPLSEFAKRFKVYFIGHSHIDLAWKWRWPETIECMKGTLENQLKLMERDPDFVFVESSAVLWKALSEKHPLLWEKCRRACDKGQLEPIGGMWCEPDAQCVGAESWARQLLYGQKAAKKYFGKECSSGFNIDAFGFNAALPKIYKAAGIENFITQKLRYNEFTIFPHTHFWWESDDGSRVLAMHIYPDHAHLIDPDDIPIISRVVHLSSGLFNIPIMFGYGNHGGGPLPAMMDRIEDLKKLTVYPVLKYSSFGDYINLLKSQEAAVLEKLPIIKDELFLETHHKTYTVQGRVKEANRECERQLLAAEALSAVAMEYGLGNTKELLEDAWQKELFNQFHDILPGTSIPSVYQDVFEDYGKALAEIRSARDILTDRLLGKGNTYYLFNSLAWRRDAVISLPVSDFKQNGMLVDTRGNVVPYQRTADGSGIIFVAKDLPGLGFETYKKTDEALSADRLLSSGDNWAENEFFRAVFDEKEGVITSLLINGLDIVEKSIGRLNFLEDTCFRDYKTWNMGLTGREFHPECTSFEKIEDGPVRVVFRARYSFGLWEKKKELYGGPILWHTPGVEYPTSFFTQDFIIYSGVNRIECVLNVDWWEDDIILKVVADTALKDTRATYSIPFGTIERPTTRDTAYEKARYEVPAINWADLYDENKNVGLAILNRSRHGYNALGGSLGLTLLTSPQGDSDRNNVPDPLVDRGKHRIEYAFYPHIGSYKAANMHKWAAEYECPVMLLQGNEKNKAALGADMLTVNPEELMVTAAKPAEDGNGIIVRVFEPYGNEAVVKFKGNLTKKNAIGVDILEREIKTDIRKLNPHQIKTIRFSER